MTSTLAARPAEQRAVPSPIDFATGMSADRRALAKLVAEQRWAEAARAAWALRAPLEAATHAWRAGLHFEAGLCFLAAREPTRALNCFFRVAPEHPRYREACVRTVGIAARGGRVDARLDAFLGPWFRSAPRDEAEMHALVELARLHALHGDPATTVAILQRVGGELPVDAMRDVAALVHDGPPARAGISVEESREDLLSADAFAELQRPASETKAFTLAEAEVADEWLEPTTISTFGPGALIGGRYRLRERLGSGAMAVVYRAHDEERSVDVALKIFKAAARDDAADERFRREALVARSLAHDNVLLVFDAGSTAQHRFLIMDLLAGQDLAAVLRAGRPTFQESVRLLVQLCRGLAHAHAHGVVHRDVKPANLFLCDDGLLKIMDFGIAKHVHAKGLTVTGQFMGTPEYMAPEQITDFANARASSDLYAVGCVAYELCTGAPPFGHPDVMALLMQHLTAPPRPPRLVEPAVPPALEDVILRLLAKDPAARFASAAEVGAALLAL